MPLERECPICRETFTAGKRDQKYCGRTCFHISKRKKVIKTRYRTLHVDKDHPLICNGEVLPEHRVILWEKIGPGSHVCHHCQQSVTWMVGVGPSVPGALVVDHLDRNSLNNDPDNLVPSCQPCNLLNSDHIVRDDEDYRVTAKGTRVRGERRNCEYCQGSFVAWPTSKKDRLRGRFCSRSCGKRAPRLPVGA